MSPLADLCLAILAAALVGVALGILYEKFFR